jgi:hypothetical protein
VRRWCRPALCQRRTGRDVESRPRLRSCALDVCRRVCATLTQVGAPDPSATPVAGFDAAAATPVGGAMFETPNIHAAAQSMDPAALQQMRWERELDARNRPLSDEELDAMFPQVTRLRDPPPSLPLPAGAAKTGTMRGCIAARPALPRPGRSRPASAGAGGDNGIATM